MRLGSGIAPVKNYMAAGVKVGLGVDGSASNDSSNILMEARQAMLLARLRLGLLPPEGPRKYMFLSQSHPVRADEWMTAREALELATIGGARVLGRSDIGALEPGKCADFFSLDLNTVGYGRRPARPGGGSAVLRATAGAPHGGQRQVGGARRRDRHHGHEAGDHHAQPLRGKAARGLSPQRHVDHATTGLTVSD
jgi:hypothetical protein